MAGGVWTAYLILPTGNSEENLEPIGLFGHHVIAVENTLIFIIYLIEPFFHEKPHTCQPGVEGREALLTELNIVMRTLFRIKEDVNYIPVYLPFNPILFCQKKF